MIVAQKRDGVLDIAISNPPVNALGISVRRGLVEAIVQAQSDDTVKSILIRGDDRLFSGGADIGEFGHPMEEPWLPAVVDIIEASAKPVVAAIHGAAMGGGLEIALGCHFRVATASAKLGLPEVKLGLIPGAGGTQRLPRLVGVDTALQMIVFGQPIAGTKAVEIGLVDALVEEATFLEEALAFARAVKGVRRTSEMPIAGGAEMVDRFLTEQGRKFAHLDAPKACAEAVRAATQLAFADGLRKEQELFTTLLRGDQSHALRHAFFAERAAAKVDGMPKDIAPWSILSVGVIGAGTMGGGISMNFLSAGIPVTLVETNREALDRGVGVIARNYQASAAKGRLRQEQVDAAMGLLTPTLEFDGLANCDLVIEAVYENMEIKREIFARLDRVMKPGAILASNTSFLDINEMAAVTRRPKDVLGLHFFSPANVMRLVEVIRGASTDLDTLATGMDIARKIGKVPVVSGVCYGFIGNRMLMARQNNAYALLLEGATPAQIDQVHTGFGMPMGPFQMADLAGVDIGWHRDPERIDSISDALCAQRRWGQKTGAGYYDYDEKRQPTPSPVVSRIIEDFRQRSGRSQRAVDEQEITVRTLYSLVNEGARILEEGIAQRASDIDVVWLTGYGWPAHTGGPMFWAQKIGLNLIVEGLNRYRDALGPDFMLSPLLARSAERGLLLDARAT